MPAERRNAAELSGIPGKGTHGGDRSSSTMRLDDLGVSKAESNRWQAVAAIPDDEFEDPVASLYIDIRCAFLGTATMCHPRGFTNHLPTNGKLQSKTHQSLGGIMAQERRPLPSEILSQQQKKLSNDVREKIEGEHRTVLARANNDKTWWTSH